MADTAQIISISRGRVSRYIVISAFQPIHDWGLKIPVANRDISDGLDTTHPPFPASLAKHEPEPVPTPAPASVPNKD